MIFLSICLFFSLVVNGVLAWYAKKLTQQFIFFSDNVEMLEDSLSSFDAHLKGVNELETFYGDETLGGLIEHSKAIVDTVQQFYNGFSLEDTTEEEDGEA
jgi:hypothetical protein